MKTMTTAEAAAWAKVEGFLAAADSVAFDGCHKIYVLADKKGTRTQRSHGYGDGTDSSELVLIADLTDPLDTVKDWNEKSCCLRFVNGIKGTGNANADYVRLIAQGEEEEWEEQDETDCTCHDLPADEPCGLHG